MLADLYARDRGGDWLERTANALGRIGFEIPHVNGSGTTGEPEHDDRIGFTFGAGAGFGGVRFEAEQLRQGQP